MKGAPWASRPSRGLPAIIKDSSTGRRRCVIAFGNIQLHGEAKIGVLDMKKVGFSASPDAAIRFGDECSASDGTVS